jgi:hypothetical protein
MPIPIACGCGKKMSVADKYAGLRVKCPECGDPLIVPEMKRTAPSRPARDDEDEDRPRRRRPDDDDEERPARRRDRDDDSIQESPRRRVAAGEEDRPVSRRRDDDDDDRPVRRARGRDDDFDDDDRPVRRGRDRDDDLDEDDGREEPRRKKRSRKKESKALWPVLLICGAGLFVLLLGGGLTAFFLLRNGGGTDNDLAFLPPDADAFATFRPADVWKLEFSQRVLPLLRARSGGKDVMGTMEKELGLTPQDVERFSVVYQDLRPDPNHKPIWWIVMRTLKPYDRSKIVSRHASPRTITHEGRTFNIGKVYNDPANQAAGMEDEAVYFAGSRVLIMSDETGMKRCLTAVARKSATGPLTAALQQAGGNSHLVVGFAPNGTIQQEMRNLGATAPPQAKGMLALLDLTAVSVMGNLDGDALKLDAGVAYPDPAKANSAKKAFDAIIALGQLAPLPDEQKKTLDSITSSVSGNDLKVQMKFDTKTLEALIRQQGAMPFGGGMNRGPNPGPPPGMPNMPRGGRRGPKR